MLRHRSVVRHYSTETARKRCTLLYKSFAPKICALLKKTPYVCNKCQKLRSCSHDFFFYRAKYADDAHHEVKSSSRSGINQTPESLEQLDKLISPLLKQGQPLSHIYLSHKEEISCSQRTLYNYINQNLFTVSNVNSSKRGHMLRTNGALSPF